ncbi:MAG: hypothetical protein HN431_08805 [Bacteroidetes bacterium]|nr:hypothetical protein [Bacteroidota bacterium]
MKKLTLSLFVLFLSIVSAIAQKEFTPSGNPFIKVFSNYHYGYDGTTGFEVNRAYLGYNYNMSENWSGKVTLDVGKPSVEIGDSLSGSTSLEYTAFLKIAALTYTSGKFSVDFGLVGTKNFKAQETVWGHRYIMKSFQDEHKYASSADLGVILTYEFTDFISVDLSILNGEGHKKIQVDNRFRTGLGITIEPVDGFIIREYADYLPGDNDPQISSATFIGYKKDKLATGVEYNMQLNNKTNTDQDLNGISVYASYDINKKYQVFGRYDMLSSNTLTGTTDPWNTAKNGSAITTGLQYTPIEYVKIALNYQGWIPEMAGEDIAHFAFLNVETAF